MNIFILQIKRMELAGVKVLNSSVLREFIYECDIIFICFTVALLLCLKSKNLLYLYINTNYIKNKFHVSLMKNLILNKVSKHSLLVFPFFT